MRIEKRDGVEWLVDVTGGIGDCDEISPCGSFLCTRHLNGDHIAGGTHAPDGSIRVEARWPIAEESAQSDPFARGIVEGLRRIESMMRDLEQRHGIGAERKLELLAECIALEIADVNDAIANRLPVEPTRGAR